MESEIQQEELIEYSFNEQESKKITDYECKKFLKFTIDFIIIFGFLFILLRLSLLLIY